MKKIFALFSLLLFSLLIGCTTTTTNLTTTNQTTTETTTTKPGLSANTISSIEVLTENPIKNDQVEFKLVEDNPQIEKLGNPYDTKYIKVYAEFTSPSGQTYVRPGYWTQDYVIKLLPVTSVTDKIYFDDEPTGNEMVTLSGKKHFRVNFLPTEAGEWNYTIHIENEGVEIQTISDSIVVSDSEVEYKGVLKVDDKNNHNFAYPSGETFIPVGQNVGWYTSSQRKSHDYDVWFKYMAEVGCNTARVWMAEWSFALHMSGSYDNFDKALNKAARLDRVLELAEEYDIQVFLTLINHGQFSTETNPEWSKNPYNKANGGMLSTPIQFFISAEAKEVYKNELWYIVGRYGSTKALLAYELFNEVGWVTGFNDHYIGLWHSEMANYIKSIDSYNHMVTTSYCYNTGQSYSKDSIDFANLHAYYHTVFLEEIPAKQKETYRLYNKPAFQQEVGVDYETGQGSAAKDPTGVSIHQANWAGVLGGGAGTAMQWWWDSWVHPNNLYYRFEGIAKYASQLNMSSNRYEHLSDTNYTLSSNKLGVLGYLLDDRIYGYIYEKSWTYLKPNVSSVSNVDATFEIEDGIYTLEVYDTVTGDVIKTEQITVVNNTATLHFDEIQNDIAFIIKK